MKKGLGVLIALALASLPALAAGELYVAPGGNNDAEGSREAPLATVEAAAGRLPQGGTVWMLGGVYRDQVALEAGAEEPLTIRAVEGEEVIFDGGAVVGAWRKEEGGSDLYSAALPKGVGEAARVYLNLWDRKSRVRLIRAMDEGGVRAWPKTFVLTKGRRLLVHLPGGMPEAGSLECNRVDRGIFVRRPNVTIRGLTFRNYFQNHYSAAVSVGAVKNVEIADCRMMNVSKAVAVAPEADDVRVLRCEIRDAGTAIASSGNRTTVEDCVIEGAQGDFAIHDLTRVLRCGIRIYHPAVGATVRRNVTHGFAHGLRIKSREYQGQGEDWPPYLIEGNTFLDGVSITLPMLEWFYKESRLTRNVVGMDQSEMAVFTMQQKVAQTAQDNYLYRPESELEEEGLMPDPFRDAAKGDLRLKDGVELPENYGAPYRELVWVSQPEGSEVSRPDRKSRPFERQGKGAQQIYVRAGADAATADGSEAKPYPALQPALDQVEPGDTVLVGEGVYPEAATLTRSGTSEAPIILKGAGAGATVLDGGRRVGALLTICDARHVKVEGMTFRWFNEAGLNVIDSPQVTVEKCRFFNGELTGRGSSMGYGIFAQKSPQLLVSHSIFSRNRVGMKLVDSPQSVIRQNTGFKNLNTAVEMVRSCHRSSITHNSFGYSSHASIYLWEPNPLALESLECDYNNYASRLYHYRKYQEGTEPPTEVLEVPARYGSVSGAKAVVDVLDSRIDNKPRIRYHDLASWQKAHGKDAHSVFADPAYRAPQEGDFRLLRESPNLLEPGEWIGACDSI